MKVFNTSDALAVLSKLISFKTVNGNELQVAEYLQELFSQHGIDSKIIQLKNGRANLVAEIGKNAPILAVSGHMDVVSPGDLKLWQSDPFILTEKNEILYGRGVTDMKAGLAAMVIAMIELHAQNLPKVGTIRLLATMGEEVGEAGSAAFYESGYMRDADGLLVGEPSSIYGTASRQKGSYDLKLISKGKSVHSSTPERGYNALVPLIQLLTEANANFEKIPDGAMGPLRFNVDVLNGGDQVNSLPDHAEAQVNIRTIPEYTNERVTAAINQLIQKYNAAGAQISLETIMNEPPISTNENNAMVTLIQKIGKNYAGQDVVVQPSPGITDASNLAKNQPKKFPFAIYGPGDMSQHQVNESLPKQMYFDFIDLYQELFIKFLNEQS